MSLIRFIVFAFLHGIAVTALGQKRTITFEKSNGSLPLVSNGKTTTLFVSGNDYPGVVRAAQDVTSDFGRVSNHNLSLTVTNATSISPTSLNTTSTVLIAGTLGHSSLIDELSSKSGNNASSIRGKWETFTTEVVTDPFPGISSAVVITGSDKRGTIFGLYDLSEQIGVSPWYWFADVAPAQHNEIYFQDSGVTVQGPPSVKYRGLFLNDEEPALTNWVNENYPQGKYGAGYNRDFYAHVFELLLRLKANFLWPAMWNSMFGIDDPENQPLADMYGIVMSTSHTEPMMRSVKEWNIFGQGPWDYSINAENIYSFWRDGAERTKAYENMWTMGMRGSGDTPLTGSGNLTALLGKIVSDQRQLLSDVYNISDEDVVKIPQAWCLYKDILSYYEAGLRVPDDMVLLWTDDNYGNVRRLPIEDELSRVGGAGIYYHFEYVGEPRSYKWINTVQHEKTWEQLHLTYQRGAREIWVVNVADLKPLEMPLDYFLNLAYDFQTWGGINQLQNYTTQWATREFGSAHASEISSIVTTYGFLAARRKYELVDPSTYSVVNYNEGDNVLKEWQNLTARAQAVYDTLPPASKPAFFEMVLHPSRAGYIVNDIHISTAKNNLYGLQRRTVANSMAEYVLKRFADDEALRQEYHALLNGKWNHIMDQTHLGYDIWNQPMRDTLPPLVWTQANRDVTSGPMGIAIEGTNSSLPGDDPYSNANQTLVLPPLDPYSVVSSRWIDVFSRGTEPFGFHVAPEEPWVRVSPTSGHIDPADPDTDNVRLEVSVDWGQVPEGQSSSLINVTVDGGDYGNYPRPPIRLPVNKTVVPPSFSGFVESDGYVAMEAEHATRGLSSNGPARASNSADNSTEPVRYEVIENFGRTLSGVALFPVLAPSQRPPNAPTLEYNTYLFTPSLSSNATNITVTMYLAAALNQYPSRPLKYAVALDGASPQTVQYVIDPENPLDMPAGWSEMVSDGNTRKSETVHTVAGNSTASGAHTFKVWLLEPGVVLERIVMDLGGVRESYLGPPESTRI